MTQPADIVEFWFRPAHAEKWFKKDAAFDRLIRRSFLKTQEEAAAGKLSHWQRSPAGSLALVITLDQFPRNLYRDSARAFATDEQARAAAGWAVQREFDLQLENADQRMFLYMPFMHSEDLQHQRLCIDLMKRGGCGDETLKHAYGHMKIIERYGRFPHRNAVLGRRNTDEEERYLAGPDAGF